MCVVFFFVRYLFVVNKNHFLLFIFFVSLKTLISYDFLTFFCVLLKVNEYIGVIPFIFVRLYAFVIVVADEESKRETKIKRKKF